MTTTTEDKPIRLNRYFDAKSNVSRQTFRAAAIGMLSFNGGLIILLGGMISQPAIFVTLFAILLLIDGT
jgi:hypothetical protein